MLHALSCSFTIKEFVHEEKPSELLDTVVFDGRVSSAKLVFQENVRIADIYVCLYVHIHT